MRDKETADDGVESSTPPLAAERPARGVGYLLAMSARS
jgi:hypothetical protein